MEEHEASSSPVQEPAHVPVGLHLGWVRDLPRVAVDDEREVPLVAEAVGPIAARPEVPLPQALPSSGRGRSRLANWNPVLNQARREEEALAQEQ
jgi:hypothetical protein